MSECILKKNTYKFEARDSFFPQTFNGEILANNEVEAIKLLKEQYAEELDTTEEEISIKVFLN